MINQWKKFISSNELIQLNKMSDEEFSESFAKELEFGTAGIRGILGIGPNRMNIYQVRKVISGYSKYLVELGRNSVCISYDNRRMSYSFFKEAVNVFGTFGIKVFSFADVRPTPFLSYAIRELKADGGVMITASHNPSNYNGIKLYDSEGCQYTPKFIKPIIDHIRSSNYFDEFKNHESIKVDIDTSYINMVRGVKISKHSSIRALFTPLHGAGGVFIKEIIDDIEVVDEQMELDENFSTCKYPNPDSAEAFTLAVSKGKYDIILATDPDADRLGCMVWHNGYQLLSGNDIGVLILDYLLKNNQRGVIYRSIVSTSLVDRIANKYNLSVKKVLTGFKYIGEGIEKDTEPFLFGFEESNGYLLNSSVRDKDALQACVILHEIASYYKERDMTLIDGLESIYDEYGRVTCETLSYELSGETGRNKMKEIISFLKNNNIIDDNSTNSRIDCGYIDDNIIIQVFDGGKITTRPSGTEPKIKFYVEILPESRLSIESIEKSISKIIN